MKIGDKVTPKHMEQHVSESQNWKEEAGIKMGQVYTVEDMHNGEITLKETAFLLMADDFKVVKSTEPEITIFDKLENFVQELQNTSTTTRDYGYVIKQLKTIIKESK